ncbi:DUF6415 family natural product biosynthesis protein [Streptomyces sp. SGAir0957]
MHQPTQHTPPDEDTRTALIAEAEAATGILPPISRLEELDRLLRAELAAVTRTVRGQANRLDHGTTAWYLRDRAIGQAKDTCARDLGVGLRSAALHVSELGRCLQALDDFARPANRSQRSDGL